MTNENTRHERQDVELLPALRTILQGLQGTSTLAYELIQNADDVDGISCISFDICDDALIVKNDGVFSKIDFDRIKNIAKGGKREESDTTGEFGIGFLSVYQITDNPEIISSGQRWTFCPNGPPEERIKIEENIETENTCFRLPWADNPESELRKGLRLDAINLANLDKFEQEISEALSLASLFLKRLRKLELKRSGKLIKEILREESDDSILIKDGEDVLIWRIFQGNFSDEAKSLRTKNSNIEDTRHSVVKLAIPDKPLDKARLFAVLPTKEEITLPFHIDANFFPSSNRKQILFEDGYQSEWNRAIIGAATSILVDNFDKLPKLLGPKGILKLLKTLHTCKQEVEKGQYDNVFNTFWDKVSINLNTKTIVFTTTKKWVTPDKAQILDSKAERDAVSILEALDISIVDFDLKDYYSLLRKKEIGTTSLKVIDIVEALNKAGLNKQITLEQAPTKLRTVEGWQLLWSALDAILERYTNDDNKIEAHKMLCESAIAFDIDRTLCTPSNLFRADDKTRELFSEIQWLAEEYCQNNQIPCSLVEEFEVKDAIDFLLEKSGQLREWCNNKSNIGPLYSWFADNRLEILNNPLLKSEICKLAIWPSSDDFVPLTDLFLPCGFDDPLKSAKLIDSEILGEHKEFLKELGVKELTFTTYANEQVPNVYPNLSNSDRRLLVQLLARKVGVIMDNSKLFSNLNSLPLIECADGQFRQAESVYCQSFSNNFLDNIHIAKNIEENSSAINALNEWLGVARQPRSVDIIDRVERLVANPPDEEAKKVVEKIFEYLADKWDKNKEQEYEKLKQIEWLPNDKNKKQWYQPEKLYTIFRKHLFESQAKFLAFSSKVKIQASRKDGFTKFLGIKNEPELELVVLHLIDCIPSNKEVKGVYEFLNNHVDELGKLKQMNCIFTDGSYRNPQEIFWGQHELGNFCYRLDSVRYRELFEKLGVREKPESQDFINVLLKISEQYEQSSHAPLDEETKIIAIYCWKQLSIALKEDGFSKDSLNELKKYKVIIDKRGLLGKPECTFFEGRAELATKFTTLENNVIECPQGAWQAMEEVGVRFLEEVIKSEIVEYGDPIDDIKLKNLIKERRLSIHRVLENIFESYDENESLTEKIDELQFQQSKKLVIQHKMPSPFQESIQEEVSAWQNKSVVLFVKENGNIPSYATIARVIAEVITHRTTQRKELCLLSSGIIHVLTSASSDEAEKMLDELRYRPLQKKIDTTDRPEDETYNIDENNSHDEVTQQPELPSIPSVSKDVDEVTQQSELPFNTSVRKDVGSPAKSRRTSDSKLRSYVTNNNNTKTNVNKKYNNHDEIKKIEQAGIDRVVAYEKNKGRDAIDMNTIYHNNPGYDIESTDKQSNIIRYIEVKTKEGIWREYNAAGLTPTQFKKAKEEAEQFWLYVVDNVFDDEKYNIYCIQNPANKITEFLFDDGWSDIADDESYLSVDN